MSAPRVGNSSLIAIFGKMYPFVLVVNSAIAIIICSIVTDQMASELIFKDESKGQFVFGLLPALSEER